MMTKNPRLFTGILLVVTFFCAAQEQLRPEVTPIQCYECTGRSGDGGCGTPFIGAKLKRCNGTACMVTRKLVDIKEATCGSWSLIVDSSYRGGWVDNSVLVLNCLEACFRQPGCASIDWKPFKPGGQNCLMHGAATNLDLVSETNSYHFDLKRTPATCPPCGPQWISTPNMGFTDSIASAVTKLKDCLSACVGDIKCSAVDFNPNKAFGERCKLVMRSLTAQYMTIPGSTHYDLYRRPDCRGGGFELIVRNCSGSWWRRRRGCRQLAGVKFGVDCSCSTPLCNAESNSLILNDYHVVRELYFAELFDIIDESYPVGVARVGRKSKLSFQMYGFSGLFRSMSSQRHISVIGAWPQITGLLLTEASLYVRH